MAIKRTVHDDGSWTETGETPKDAKDLYEKHRKDIQSHGEQKFHEAFVKQQSTGFEKLRDPSGAVVSVPTNEAEKALASGYGAVSNPRMVVGDLPWPKQPQTPGRHRYRYNPLTGQMEET